MSILITAMAKVIVCMAVGFFLRKIKLFNDISNKAMSSLIIHVTAPCLLFSSIATMDGSESENAVTLLWVGFVLYGVLIALAILVTKLLKVSPSSRGVYEAAMIFGNVSFMGIPLVESLYGTLGVFYIAFLNIHFNIFFYSLGFYLIMKSGKRTGSFNPLKLINSGIIGILLASVIFFLQVPLPEVVTVPISFVGSITSPLSMVIIGSSVAAYSLKHVFSQKKIYILSFLRLLVYPVIAYFLLRLLLGDNLITRIICIYIGMPVASIVGMTAIAYDADSESATYCIAMSTVLSLVTIPILYLIMS